MDFSFTQEQDRFRQEVRDFLEDELKQGTFKPSCDAWIQGYSPEFTKKLAKKGWIGLTWPKEYGGQGRGHMDRLILTEEILRYGAPAACHWFADRQIGGGILRYGTEEQKKELLPKIIAGEAYVGLGMSEPEAGSDLASLRTKATEDGDDYIIDGQKMWTSCGMFMNYIYLVARTDLNPETPKHRGISEFVFPTDLSGITITPTIDITGSTAWAEVFFDGVRVPKKYLIGEKNRGFYQVVNALDYERAGLERLMGNYPLFDAIVKFTKETKRNGKPMAQEPQIRQRLAQLETEFEIGRLLTYRVVMVMEEGKAPNVEAATAKAYSTAFEQHLASLAMDILGPYGQLLGDSKRAPVLGMAPHSYLGSTGYSLQAGTSEVLRNIIALRGLGLPTS
ncbi:MAG: acyl-CoA dehydrogenase family protein [Dehalococcoidales bacterium]|nr:acyl-CoA dehydrogenase family protein [Dehalococcoidales bacterium]